VRLIVVGEGMRPFRGAEQIAYQVPARGQLGQGALRPLGDRPTASSSSASTRSRWRRRPRSPRRRRARRPHPPPVYSRADEQPIARAITGLLLTEG
jgi:hypothetical protein